MKKFLKNILIFLLPIIVLAYPLDYFLSTTFAKSHWPADEIAVNRAINNGEINAEIAIYGSSRAWRHFNTAIIADSLNRATYNFGYDGHNFWLQYYRHKEYISHNPSPKIIILSIDVFTLQRVKELYALEQFLPTMYADYELYQWLKVYKGYSFFDYYIPLWRYIGKKEVFMQILKILLNKAEQQPKRVNGYQGSEQNWTDDLVNARAQKAYYTVEQNEESILLFEQFIQECQADNISLYMVYSPEYVEGQSFILNKGDVVATFEKIAQKYNIPLLDYTQHAICSDTTYFYNSMHLNAKGADKFTSILMQDMISKFPNLVKAN